MVRWFVAPTRFCPLYLHSSDEITILYHRPVLKARVDILLLWRPSDLLPTTTEILGELGTQQLTD